MPAALIVVLVAFLFAACGGSDDEPATDPAPPEAPSLGATPSDPGALPPEFVECMADQGYEVASQADIHSAPPEVLQACFGEVH